MGSSFGKNVNNGFGSSGSGGSGNTVPNDSYYTAANFTTNTECADIGLTGVRFRLNWRGYGFLIPNIEWETLPSGGFNILIPGFNVNDDSNNTFQVECY